MTGRGGPSEAAWAAFNRVVEESGDLDAAAEAFYDRVVRDVVEDVRKHRLETDDRMIQYVAEYVERTFGGGS